MAPEMEGNLAKPIANVPRPSAMDCAHSRVEVLGVSGSATYLRCGCGLLLVSLNGQMCPFGRTLK